MATLGSTLDEDDEKVISFIAEIANVEFDADESLEGCDCNNTTQLELPVASAEASGLDSETFELMDDGECF